jgi:N-acylneuraminate cytidylyltransferase
MSNGNIQMLYPENELVRSQDLEECYHDVGQFYWLNVNEFLDKKSMYLKPSKPVILDSKYCQDIDTIEDWEIAEMKYEILKRSK